MPSPTIAASTEPSSVARIVIFTPWISVGMICQTKSQSHSISQRPARRRGRAPGGAPAQRMPKEMTRPWRNRGRRMVAKGTSVLPVWARTTCAWKVMSVERDQRDDRGRLQQLDGVVAEGRQHHQKRLRQDDVAHALPAAEIERDAGLVLLAADRLDGAAHHFGPIGADIQAERQHAGLQRRQREADEAAARNRPRTAARRSRCRGRTRYRRWPARAARRSATAARARRRRP